MKNVFIVIILMFWASVCSAQVVNPDYKKKIAEIEERDSQLQKDLTDAQTKALLIQQQLLIDLGAKSQLESLIREQDSINKK